MNKINTLVYCISVLIFAGYLSASEPITKQKSAGFFINSNPKGATVYIEDEMIGKTPCSFPYEINGKYRIWMTKPGYEKRSVKIDFNKVHPDSMYFNLSMKSAGKAISRSLILPGWGQVYSEKVLKGRIFTIVQVVSLVSLGVAHLNYDSKLDNYNDQLNNYERMSLSFENEKLAWKNLESAHQKVEDAYDLRRIFLYTAAAVYIVNLLDTAVFFSKPVPQINILPSPAVRSGDRLDEIKIQLSWDF